MKRFFTLFTTVVVFLYAHAQVGYVIPYTPDVAYSDELVVNNYIPQENSTAGDESPERKAYEWFHDTYINAEYFTVKDVKDGKLLSDGVPTIKALWINVDKVGYELSSFDDLFNTDVKAALRSYVEAGGNLYLSKQATRLVTGIGRCSWWPNDYKCDGYGQANDRWYVTNKFAGYDHSGHAVFSNMTGYDNYRFPMTWGNGNDYYRTDNNCGWGAWDIYASGVGEGDIEDGKNKRITTFEAHEDCQILGGWGHTQNMQYAGLIEFFPKEVGVNDFKGTVVVMGLAAYQWGTSNTDVGNVKALTKGILDYLSQRVTASWTTSPKANPIIKEEENVAITMSEHCSLSFTSSDVTKAEINAEGHISYNHFGEVTIKAVVTGDGENIPKNKVELSEIRTVTGGTIASYAYALPFSFYTMNNYAGDDGTWKPDYQAAKWFYDNYVVTGKGCFINPTNYSSSTPIPPTIKVLWVNNDHKDLSSPDLYSNFGGDNFRDALSDFVVAGGNVFLSKQATRFIGDIGRAQRWPSYGVSTEGPADGPWYMVDNFVAVTIGTPGGSGVSLHDHPVYATLRATKADQYTEHIWTDDNSVVHNEGYCKWPLFAGEGNRTKMTYIWGEPTSVWSESYGMASGTRTIEYATLTDFETNAGMKCKILGGWGHTTALDAVGFAEFPPATIDEKTFGGSVICIGLPAYQWSVGNTYIGNVRALTQGILDYLGGVVVVTKPETDLTNTTVDELVIYQGGSVSNPGDITINNSITYVRPAVGGTAENELGHWYTFCLPFTPSSVKVLDEDDGFDYDINSVYLTGGEADTSEPEGSGYFYLQTFSSFDNVNTHWAYIENPGIPTKYTPYIIKFIDAAEDSEKGNPGLATYFTSNPVIKFIGGAQTISGTDDGTSGVATGDFSFHVNKTLRKLTLSGIYPLNTETNMFEYDYGDESTIMPFECYIKASTPALAAACPRIMIGRKATQDTNSTTSIENPTAESHSPVFVYDVTGRLFHIGDKPLQLPQGIWIVRQGKDSRTIVIP